MAHTLTGKRRFRQEEVGRWIFKRTLLVLQVEVAGHEMENCGSFIDSYPVRYFRDATIEDLTTEELANG